MKKTSKLLKIVKRFVSAAEHKQQEHTKCFTDVLKKLKKKQIELKKKLKAEHNDKARKLIKQELLIVYEQRKKGLKAIKKLKNNK